MKARRLTTNTPTHRVLEQRLPVRMEMGDRLCVQRNRTDRFYKIKTTFAKHVLLTLH